MNETIIKAGTVFLKEEKLRELFEQGNIFLVTYKTAREIRYSRNCGWHFAIVHNYRGKLPLVGRGRFVALNAARTNSLIGHDLFIQP